MMVEQYDEEEKVTTYVLMSLLDGSESQETGAYEEEFNFVYEDNMKNETLRKAGPNFYQERLEEDKSLVTAWYRNNPSMLTREGNTLIFRQDMRVIGSLRKDMMSSIIVLTKGCKVVYAKYCRIKVVTTGNMKLSFKLKSDGLYHVKIDVKCEDNEEEESIDMETLNKFLETYVRVTQRHGMISPGRVRLGWLGIQENNLSNPECMAHVSNKKVAATTHRRKKFRVHDQRIERLAREDLNMEAGLLTEMLEESTYIEITDTYHSYCEAVGMEPPSKDHVFEFKTEQHEPGQEMRHWVKQFKYIVTRDEIGMKQCKDDTCMFIKHDQDGMLTLWAVLLCDDVIYGGVKSETDNLKSLVTSHVTIVEIGKLDVYSGVRHMLDTNVYAPGFAHSMEECMGSINWKEAIHVKHAANIYNGTFHPTIGEGVESTSYVRPYGRKRDSVMATESDGTKADGIETTVDSFRSDG
jgi:hypothetical protein